MNPLAEHQRLATAFVWTGRPKFSSDQTRREMTKDEVLEYLKEPDPNDPSTYGFAFFDVQVTPRTPKNGPDLCCAEMGLHSQRCRDHETDHACADVLVIVNSAGRGAIPVRDGGTSVVVINFCPWCGANRLVKP